MPGYVVAEIRVVGKLVIVTKNSLSLAAQKLKLKNARCAATLAGAVEPLSLWEASIITLPRSMSPIPGP